MKPDLRFTFQADMPAHRLTITRDFAAPKALVWRCHSEADLLDRWFAPEPFTARTKSMDFSDGGHWHFAMVDPDGAEFWNRFDYIRIEAQDRYTSRDAFSDADGAVNPDMPTSDWEVRFTGEGDRTTVRTVIAYASEKDLQTVIDMGMEAGLANSLTRLDTLLDDLTTERIPT
ncbi:SRPBCC domain-containing protein [Sagittula sp.]|uniref:SRPBCC family protein n=1 Tax=Sagittula sp. TaxID=2038081 RepID=UPI0035158EC3